MLQPSYRWSRGRPLWTSPGTVDTSSLLSGTRIRPLVAETDSGRILFVAYVCFYHVSVNRIADTGMKMKTEAFTWIALGLGLAIAMVALPASVQDAGGGTALPLLTLLFLNEFGFILTAIGTALGIRRLRASGLRFALLAAVTGCVVLAILFAWLGLSLWSSTGAA